MPRLHAHDCRCAICAAHRPGAPHPSLLGLAEAALLAALLWAFPVRWLLAALWRVLS